MLVNHISRPFCKISIHTNISPESINNRNLIPTRLSASPGRRLGFLWHAPRSLRHCNSSYGECRNIPCYPFPVSLFLISIWDPTIWIMPIDFASFFRLDKKNSQGDPTACKEYTSVCVCGCRSVVLWKRFSSLISLSKIDRLLN